MDESTNNGTNDSMLRSETWEALSDIPIKGRDFVKERAIYVRCHLAR